MEPDDKTFIITNMSGNSDTITIDLNNTYGATTSYSVGDISISDGNITVYSDSKDWITIADGSTDINIDWNNISNLTLEPVLWEDRLPDPETVKKMCEQYPALAKAYENFKTIYSMVEQDWKGNHGDDKDYPF